MLPPFYSHTLYKAQMLLFSTDAIYVLSSENAVALADMLFCLMRYYFIQKKTADSQQ